MRHRRRPLQLRRVLQLAAAVAVVLVLRGVRIDRSVGNTTGPLSLPARWPSCSPDRAAAAHVTSAPALSATFDGAGARYAIVSTWAPTRCGIATYSAGLRDGFLASGAKVDVLAMHLRSSGELSYGPEVVLTIQQDSADDYTRAAAFIAEQCYDAVFVQHEYGIFGGYRGELVVQLVRGAAQSAPVVTTLHTVESVPNPQVQHALAQLLAHSVAIAALSPSGCRSADGWAKTVGMPTVPGLCHHLPHGVPLLPLCLKSPLKRVLGFSNRFVLLCGGLLSPPKGLDNVLEALPAVAASVPNVLLVIVGQAHPVLGQHYLELLQARAATLGVESLVRFHSSYLSESNMLHLYQSADAFLCAYTSAEQTSSGTMLLAMTSGVPVIATPFAQAAELLDNGHGIIVPFNDTGAIARAAVSLARSPAMASKMRAEAHQLMATRAWPSVAASYAQLLSAGAPKLPQRPRFTPQPDDGHGVVSVFRSPLYAEVANGRVAVSVARNEKWVDGVGPGWYPTDTYLSRYRPAWGVDSLVMSGCFVSHELRAPKFDPPQRFVTRTLEEASTVFEAQETKPGAAAWLEQRWRGAVQSSGVNAVVRRCMSMSSTGAMVQLELEATLTGHVLAGTDSWLTAGFDQLSVNPALLWASATTTQGHGASEAREACRWDGQTLSISGVTAFSLQGANRATGDATALVVAVAVERAGGALNVHFTCDADRLHSVQFDVVLADSAMEPATKEAHTVLEVSWM